jgi:hypothetical protein
MTTENPLPSGSGSSVTESPEPSSTLPGSPASIDGKPTPTPIPWHWLRIEGPIADLVRKHPALGIAVISGGLVLVRTAAVSRYDPDVWHAVLTRADPTTLIFGSLALFIPTLLPLVVVLLDSARAVRHRLGHGISIALEAAFIFAIAAVTVSTSVASVVYALAGVLLFWLTRRAYRLASRVRGGSYRDWAPVGSEIQRATLLRSLFLLIIFINAYFIAISGQAWIPAENISVPNGDLVGYVLGSTGGWTSILTERDRGVVTIADTTITARQVCVLPESNDDTDLPLTWFLRRLQGEARSVPTCNIRLP